MKVIKESPENTIRPSDLGHKHFIVVFAKGMGNVRPTIYAATMDVFKGDRVVLRGINDGFTLGYEMGESWGSMSEMVDALYEKYEIHAFTTCKEWLKFILDKID